MIDPPDPPIDHHITRFPVSTVSNLAPFTALILSIVLILFFLIKFYVLELFLLRRVYGPTYTNLDENNRRGFVNHHIAGGTKIIILIVGIFPFMAVAFGTANFQTPFTRGSKITMGDILVVCAQILLGMFIFELIYRAKMSPISVAHHIGSILVGQAAIVISIKEDRDASIEFVLCTVWGAFDIISEFLPHLAIILYRVFPNSNMFLCNLFRTACLVTFMGTISETILAMYLFGQLWHRWSIAFKIVTPLLHLLFSACQLHGSNIFRRMWMKQRRILREQQKCEEKGGHVASVDSEEPERQMVEGNMQGGA